MSSSRPAVTAPRSTADFRLEDTARGNGLAYIRYREGDGFTVLALQPEVAPVYVGRHPSSAIHLADPRVSARHARILHGAGCWSIEDAGSRNGTRVDGRPVTAELRLTDGSLVEIGSTKLSFHEPEAAGVGPTVQSDTEIPDGSLAPKPTQRRVLVELARPWFAPDVTVPVAPTNTEIARRLSYQPTTVRDAISDLYRQAGLVRGDVSQRQALIDLAIRAQIITRDDYA